MAVYIGAIRKTKKKTYRTYILTAWETEIIRYWKTKKEMLEYLANELFVRKDMGSLIVNAAEIDSDGYLTNIDTKYSFYKV
jgi:hypothetical protein